MEGQRQKILEISMHQSVIIYISFLYVHIHICTYREREKEREGESAQASYFQCLRVLKVSAGPKQKAN